MKEFIKIINKKTWIGNESKLKTIDKVCNIISIYKLNPKNIIE